MESVIECRNLTHCYGRRKIYENLSFDVPEGRILGLLGKNGTGKTTNPAAASAASSARTSAGCGPSRGGASAC